MPISLLKPNAAKRLLCAVLMLAVAALPAERVAVAGATAPPPSALDSDGDGYTDAQEIAIGADPNTYCAIMRADVDGDGSVTLLDIAAIAGAFLQPSSPATTRLDQDKDGQITILDMAAASGSFLQSVTACPKAPNPAGVWTDVTPAGFNRDPNYPAAGDNYGFQQVLVDPVRPSDLYTFTNYQGVWKSTDYGVSWTMISTGSNSDAILGGRNWAATIDPNKARNPATPPTLYTQAGYSIAGKMGIWKSTDGGVDWTQVWNTMLASDGTTNITAQVWTDMQGLSVDPNNGQHILAVNHGNTVGGAYDHHIFETTNGGTTWIDRGDPAPGVHCAVAFITSTTWIATADGWGAGSPGTFVTTNSGASWTHVGQFGKGHGNVQLTYLAPSGTLYLAAMEGIYASTAPYLSWTQLDSTPTQSIIGTPSNLYVSYGWAYQGGLAPALRRAPAATATPWNANYTATPATMTNGAMGAAVTYNASTGKYIIVTGNWLGGLWRYVE